VGGASPALFFGKAFRFENLPPERWPNVVILEFAINCQISWECVKQLDVLIHIIEQKYHSESLSAPSFIILELLRMTVPLPEVDMSVEDRVKALSLHSQGMEEKGYEPDFNRGTHAGFMLNALSRFYGHSYISNADVLYPAYTRHMLDSNCSTYFPYIHPPTNSHATEFGHKFLADSIIFPFLLAQMEIDTVLTKESIAVASPPSTINSVATDNNIGDSKDSTHDECSLYTHKDIKFFSPSAYSHNGILMQWDAWGLNQGEKQERTFDHLIVTDPKWAYIRIHDRDNNQCYGSYVKDAVVDLRIRAPSTCSLSTPCSLNVHTLNSWNMSYIGDASCVLYATNPKDGTLLQQIGEEVILKGNVIANTNIQLKDTEPQAHTIKSALFQKHNVLRCRNLGDLLTCFTTIQITS
jgi:hypothetical protein